MVQSNADYGRLQVKMTAGYFDLFWRPESYRFALFLKRDMIKGEDKIALASEFREWINGIEYGDKNYDVLYINKIS